MILALALDGADAPNGGCTTHLASLILLEARRQGVQPADYPWLVRLNPSIPHKTRGNGAVVIWLRVNSRDEALRLTRLAEEMLDGYSEALGSHRKAGLVAVLFNDNVLPRREPQLVRFYYVALRRITTRRVALEHLEEARVDILSVRGGGGVIGAVAALGAQLDVDHTFEALFYMPPSMWGKRPEVPREQVKMISLKLSPYGLANYDHLRDRPLIQPHGPDPVLAGIRSDEPYSLQRVTNDIPRAYYTHFVVYRSNQHTGVHVRDAYVADTKPYDCIRVCGVLENVYDHPGGHRIGVLCDESGCMNVGFYRELGWVSKHATELTGIEVCIEGCLRPHSSKLTLNVEKVIVLEALTRGALCGRLSPVCPLCGRRLKRVSRNEYRCTKCGIHVYGFTEPLICRGVKPVLEPEPSAWHHLYMPWSRALRITRPRGLAHRGTSWDQIIGFGAHIL